MEKTNKELEKIYNELEEISCRLGKVISSDALRSSKNIELLQALNIIKKVASLD